MKIPVWPKDKCNYTDNPVIEIIDEDGKFVAKIRNVETRAYIIKAINCHEKFKKSLEDIAYGEIQRIVSGKKMRYSHAGVKQLRDIAEQALKENP